MAYMRVDVDMEDLDTDDLVSEIIRRMKSDRRQKITIKMAEQIRKEYAELDRELRKVESMGVLKTNSLYDEMKYAHLKEAFNKYTLEEIERILPIS